MQKIDSFCSALQIDFPLIMAPMFLVSNVAMMKSGMQAGIMATFPTLNYRKDSELEAVLQELQAFKTAEGPGSYGVNLIVQKTNPYYASHLSLCIKHKVP